MSRPRTPGSRPRWPRRARYPGAESIEAWVDAEDDKKVVVVESWESKEALQAYQSWRASDGVPHALIAALAAPPVSREFTVLDMDSSPLPQRTPRSDGGVAAVHHVDQPVTNDASGETRKAIIAAISSAVANRPRGCARTVRSRTAAS
ncbi:putative quinol monooxygenase [Aeromicrobium sp. UC242_57]|uniref:putative quinol monooxygenase n=1 Tax=Aeromicrobium sp. UC242_57 TaxID=3374624 RepID=UPI00378C1DF3